MWLAWLLSRKRSILRKNSFGQRMVLGGNISTIIPHTRATLVITRIVAVPIFWLSASMCSIGELGAKRLLQTFRVSHVSNQFRASLTTLQGGDTLLTDPQIITHLCEIPSDKLACISHFSLSDLGRKLFSKGNVQDTHHEFENEHQCNIFCKFFEVPTSYDQSKGAFSDPESRQNVCIHFVYILVVTYSISMKQDKQRVSGLHDLLNPETGDAYT